MLVCIDLYIRLAFSAVILDTTSPMASVVLIPPLSAA